MENENIMDATLSTVPESSWLPTLSGDTGGYHKPKHSVTRENDRGSYVFFAIERKIADSWVNQNNLAIQLYQVHQDYCFLAINNLMKKNAFLSLSLQLAENLITEEDFEKEIENNRDKYIIELHHIANPDHMLIISDIVHRISSRLTTDEVSEMFSVDLFSLNNSLNLLGKNPKF